MIASNQTQDRFDEMGQRLAGQPILWLITDFPFPAIDALNGSVDLNATGKLRFHQLRREVASLLLSTDCRADGCYGL